MSGNRDESIGLDRCQNNTYVGTPCLCGFVVLGPLLGVVVIVWIGRVYDTYRKGIFLVCLSCVWRV